MFAEFSRALEVQMRVIWAICLREVRGRHGKSRLGYVWEFVKLFFAVAVFWMIRMASMANSPMGLEPPVYLVMGFVPWFIFSGALGKTQEAVNTNTGLLTFPQVYDFDLYLSSTVVTWVTEVIVLGVFLCIVGSLGYHVRVYNPGALAAALFGIGFLALGIGMILSALQTYVEVLEKLVPMVMRVLFFTSGVFFAPGKLMPGAMDYLQWNPILHYVELGRSAFALTKVPDSIKTDYILWMTLGALALGMLLERYTRPRQRSV